MKHIKRWKRVKAKYARECVRILGDVQAVRLDILEGCGQDLRKCVSRLSTDDGEVLIGLCSTGQGGADHIYTETWSGGSCIQRGQLYGHWNMDLNMARAIVRAMKTVTRESILRDWMRQV